MADRSIVIRIRAEVAQAKAALAELAASATKVATSIEVAGIKSDGAAKALGQSATKTATATQAAARATEASTKKAAASAASAVKSAESVGAASNRLLNAQGALRLAEERLAEARVRGITAGARLSSLEEGVARARRGVTAVSVAEAAALDKAARAQASALEKTAKAAAASEVASTRTSTAFGRIGAAAAANTQHIDRLGRGMAIFGSVVGLGLGLAVKSFADFDQAMSGVAAALPDATAQMGALRAEAIKLGADTQFSATEAAQGITALAKAGVSAQSILGGGLKGSLDLAAAGQLDVAAAAEIAASAMTQFKLNGSAVPHIADLLAAGAGKAQGSVSDLGQALNQTGLIAAQTGLSIEETTGGLAAFASAGLIGSDAGTSFKTMLQRLVPQGAQAKQMFETLGISAYDSSGNFVGLAKFAGQLKDSLSKLTPEARASALQIIFGSDAVRAANVLYEQGQSGIQGWIDKTNDAGFAAEQAAKLTDNWKGDLERLGGALDSVFVNSGSGANGFLRGLTQKVDAAVTSFGHLPVVVQQGALGIVALTTGGLLAAAGLAKVVSTVKGLGESLQAMGLRGERAAGGLGKATTAAKGLATGLLAVGAAIAISNIGDGQRTLGVGALTNELLGADDAAKALNETWSKNTIRDSGFDSSIKSLGDALKTTFDPGLGAKIDDVGGNLVSAFGGKNVSNMEFARQRLSELDQTLTQLASSGNGDQAARIFDQLAASAYASGFSVDQLKQVLPGYTDAIAAAGAQTKLTGGNASTASVGIKDLGDAAQEAADKASNLDDALRNLGGGFRSERDANRATRDALRRVKDSLKLDDKGKPTASKDEQNAALDTFAARTFDSVAEAQKRGRSVAYITKLVTDNRKAFIEQATAILGSKKAAEQLADQEGLIPAEVVSTIKVSGVDDAKKKTAEIKAGLDKLSKEQVVKVNINVLGSTERRKEIQDLNEELGKTPDSKTIDVAAPGAKGARTDVDNLNTAFSNAPKSVSVPVSAPGAVGANTQARTLNDTFSRQPETKSTTISLLGAQGSMAGVMSLQASIDALHGKTVAVHVATYYDSPFDADRTARARGLWSGGYTGDGGKYQPKGIVHGGEFVQTKETTAKWRPLFEWMHAGRDPRSYFGVPGYAHGGFVPSFASMSPSVIVQPSSPSSHSEVHSQSFPNLTVITRDPAEFEQWAERKKRLAALGPRKA